jgi:hypothetical protein
MCGAISLRKVDLVNLGLIGLARSCREQFGS